MADEVGKKTVLGGVMEIEFDPKAYQKELRSQNPEEKIRMKVINEGFDPIMIRNPKGYVYPRHSHAEAKLLAVVSGGMEVRVGKEIFSLKAGSRLLIPGNVEHEAVVGNEGIAFLWAEKLI